MPSIAVEERLFSLVLALMASESGLTKADILSTVQGYSVRYQSHGDNSALERQFERDKDQLRERGIPLDTVESPDKPGDNTALRYLIPKGRYDLPADIEFTGEEVALLGLAATVWREGSLSGESSRALMKLRARGVDPSEPLLGYAPRISVRDLAFDPLQKALGESVVTFPYLKPGDAAPRKRRVYPLAIVQHDGRWHLYAHDLDAGATRTFLLSRIVGPVDARGSQKDLPDIITDGAAERALEELDALNAANVAILQTVPGSDAAVRLAHRAETTDAGLRVNFTDLDILADELAGFGPEVKVIEPARLAVAVLGRLEPVASKHAEESHDG